ncbi:MAG: hypothetical protein ABH818_00500 [Patescibacteria group bacterium]|nr:hypothetical protein [Patescibacteria group bacterium]
MKIKIIFLFCFVLILFFGINQVLANAFNPNNIISDFEILDYTSMNLNDIKKFLQNKNSYLTNYSCIDPDKKTMSVPEIIYDRAINNKISPKLILVLLQKEQSLIEDNNPNQKQLDWATGYGCPDNASCNQRWQGFWKQINSASLQFRDYMDNPHLYAYKANNTYTFTNPYGTINKEPVLVTPENQATAALYNYTPHVYNGNYNFYKLWQRYFTNNYFDGSLLQAQGEQDIWLIQNNKKRLFANKSVLISRFDINKIIQINKADLDKFETGTSIKFPQYSLIKSPRGTIFLLVDNKKRGFTSSKVFRKMGFNPTEVLNASWDDINAYADGLPLTATSTYPTGALLQDTKTGGVYWVIEGTKAPLIDKIFLTTKFNKKKIIKATTKELANYKKIAPILFDDGELLKSNISSAIYVISNNKKRLITSNEIFKQIGYKLENIITVTPKILYLYPEGKPITEIINENIT